MILTFKEHGLEQVLAEILDQKDVVDQQVLNETNALLSTLIYDEKIIATLTDANALAQKLNDNPLDIGLIEELDKRLISRSRSEHCE